MAGSSEDEVKELQTELERKTKEFCELWQFKEGCGDDKLDSGENELGMQLSINSNFENDKTEKQDEAAKYTEKPSIKKEVTSVGRMVHTTSPEFPDFFFDNLDSHLSDNSMNQSKGNTIVIEATPTEEQGPTLEDLAFSDYIRNRQLAARSILRYLQQAGTDEETVLSVVSAMCKLSVDEEFMVRSELVENFPSIALFCKSRFEVLGSIITQMIVPCTVKVLTDDQIQVRTAGHNAFLALLEHSIIDHSQLSGWICPLVAELVACGNTIEEAQVEDVSIMCSMMPHIGAELSIKFFLEPFISLCGNTALTIRKVCATNFGAICKTVRRQITETALLPAFINLCSDEELSIRKECTVVFNDVASVVSLKTRKEVLSHILISLLNDDSHYVELAAYQSLGGFIATFATLPEADEDCSDIFLNKNGMQSENKCDEKNIRGNGNSSGNQEKQTASVLNHSKSEFGSNKIVLVGVNVDHTSVSNLPNINELCHKDSSTSEGIKNSGNSSLTNNLIHDENLNLSSRICIQNILKEELEPHSIFTISTRNSSLNHNENTFNNFQYWRTPLPEVELDTSIKECKNANVCESKTRSFDVPESCSELPVKTVPETNLQLFSKIASEEQINIKVEAEHTNILSTSSEKSKILEPDTYLSNKESACLKHVKKLVKSQETFSVYSLKKKGRRDKKEKVILHQDVVPQVLLESFVSVVMDEYEYPKDDERTVFCAYNFPAVAYTLGKKYWPCIQKIHSLLSRDIKYSVRRTIASSLHTLADILDHEDIVNDILPIFLDMLKDVDAVRIKLFTDLNILLEKLNYEERKKILPLIEGFFIVDSESNWRFRYTVLKELTPCIRLFYPSDVRDNFLPVSLTYMADKVSDVRRAAMELMAKIIESLVKDPEISGHLNLLLSSFDKTYRQSCKWLKRQTYIFLCEKIAVERSLPMNLYNEEIIPYLLLLGWDSVPNVRLALSRCISLTLLPLGYISSIQQSQYNPLLLEIMNSLRNDVDKDVRYFAQLSDGAFDILHEELLPV